MIKKLKKFNEYQILFLSLPIFISSSVGILLGTADTIMVGRISAQQLAAVSAGAAIFSLVSAMLSASLVSNQILSAKYLGEDNSKKVYENLIYSIISGIFIATIAIIILVIFGKFILSMIIQEESIISIAYFYILARLPGLIINIPLITLSHVLGSLKKTKWIMFSSLMMNILNVIFGLILIFGLGPLPQLNAVGAGLSSSIAIFTGLIFILVIFKKEEIFKGISLKELNFERFAFIKSQKLNLPPLGSAFFDYFSNLIIFMIIGTLGTSFLAGGRIAFQIDMILFTIAMSLAVGGNILIGRSWGERNFNKLVNIYKSNLLLLIFIICIFSLPLIIFPNQLLLMFTDIQNIIDVTTNSVIIIGLSGPFIAISCAMAGVMRSVGRTKFDMYANILPVWIIQLPFSYIFGITLDYGLTGVYIAFLWYWITRLILSAYYVKLTFKDLKVELS